jgi:hypothetical protein
VVSPIYVFAVNLPLIGDRSKSCSLNVEDAVDPICTV